MKQIKKEEKLYIQAFREIRSYIITNNLKEGDLLPTEQEMCQTLGVSRNVLREAIKSMELMGMVQASPGRGTMVREFSLDFIFQNVLFFHVGEDDAAIRQMFGIRRMLELSYMRQAFDLMTDEDVSQLRECMNRLEESQNDARAFCAADRRFHLSVYRPLRNGVLTALMEAIWAVDDGFELEQKEPHLSASLSLHEAIVDALEKRDYCAFSQAMQAHFSSDKYLSE